MKKDKHSPNWSPELQAETERILYNMPPAVFAINKQLGRKGVQMKCYHGGYGYVTLQSCLNEKYVIQASDDDRVLFESENIANLLTAGWAVD